MDSTKNGTKGAPKTHGGNGHHDSAAPAASEPLTAHPSHDSEPRLFLISPEELEAQVAGHIAGLDAVVSALDWRYTFTSEQRATTNGRLKTSEPEAIGHLLDLADRRPALFAALAHIDGGKDDAVFETAPTRENLRRLAAVKRLASKVDELAGSLNDSVLALGEAIHQVSIPLYESARTAAKTHEAARMELAPVTDLYGHSARTRKQNAGSADAQVQKRIKLLRAQYQAELKAKIEELVTESAAASK